LLLHSLHSSFLRTEAKTKKEPTKVKTENKQTKRTFVFSRILNHGQISDASFTGILELTSKVFTW